MLDEPTLSRQWVVRRLQRLRAAELWGAPFRGGMATRMAPPEGSALGRQAAAARDRAHHLARLIQQLGSVPYGASRLARSLGTPAGWLLAAVAPGTARAAVRRLARHLLAEYASLEGLAESVPGIPGAVADRIRWLRRAVAAELEGLETDDPPPGSPT